MRACLITNRTGCRSCLLVLSCGSAITVLFAADYMKLLTVSPL